ncbi:MAG: TIGR01777 family protein [Acidobacteria bacterium]|nr:TIGR01777 family protein [Acidobacteriota bacterium]
MRLVLTGATGFLGRRLAGELAQGGHETHLLSRNPRGQAGSSRWDPMAGPPDPALFADCGAVVHLAGEPVAQRWTSAAKERILASRVRGTLNLVEGLRRCETRPEVLVCASAVGYFGSRGDEVLTERSEPGTGFLAEVCRQWEAAADTALELGIRVVKVRFGVVLGGEGGALAKMLPAFRLGLGGPLADGRQWMSWIHAADAARLLVWSAEERSARGAVNAVSPHPIQNKDFTLALGRVLRRPAVIPMPGFALGLLFGEMSEVLTGSQRVLPEAAASGGFQFRHVEVEEALRALLY